MRKEGRFISFLDDKTFQGLRSVLDSIMKELSSLGLDDSLRATAATRLYDAGVDEQLITEKTGHRSSAVRSYKRTQDAQLVKISEIIQESEKMKCESEDAGKENIKK